MRAANDVRCNVAEAVSGDWPVAVECEAQSKSKDLKLFPPCTVPDFATLAQKSDC